MKKFIFGLVAIALFAGTVPVMGANSPFSGKKRLTIKVKNRYGCHPVSTRLFPGDSDEVLVPGGGVVKFVPLSNGHWTTLGFPHGVLKRC